jgi:hypothetical protein
MTWRSPKKMISLFISSQNWALGNRLAMFSVVIDLCLLAFLITQDD